MVVMDAIVSQPETKVKSHNRDKVNNKSQSDNMTFANVIGNTTKQMTPKTEDKKPIDASNDIKLSRTADNFKNEETLQKQEISKMHETAELSQTEEIEETESIQDEELFSSGMHFNKYEAILTDFKMLLALQTEQRMQGTPGLPVSHEANTNTNEANLDLGKLMQAFKFSGKSMKQEYAMTWRMNIAQTDSISEEFSLQINPPFPETMDNEADLANTIVFNKTNDLGKAEVLDKSAMDKTFDNMAKLMQGLNGQVKETFQRPVIPLTDKVVANTPSQSQDMESMINISAPKQMESIPVGIQSTSPVAPPTTLAPQVIQAIQQAAMHLQPRQVQEITISLHPQELGKLDIAMRMENGQLHVIIKASEMNTGHFLQNQMQDLKQNLNNAGIDCADLQMDFSDHTENHSFEEAFQDGRQKFMDEKEEDQPINMDFMSREGLSHVSGMADLKRINIRA